MNRWRDWFDQAVRDVGRAELDIRYEYWEWACFTAQQAAEKGAQALLMHLGRDAWGHGITPMLRSLADPAPPPELLEKAQLLDAYYIPTRYPNGFASGKPADYFNEPKARETLDAAYAVLVFCKDRLP